MRLVLLLAHVRTSFFFWKSLCESLNIDAVLYGFSLAYLVAPGTFDSVHVIEFVAGLPDAVKYAGKTLLALPFTFHSINGLRHLAWDSGKCTYFLLVHLFDTQRLPVLSLKSAYSTGYAVLGATVISTIALVLV